MIVPEWVHDAVFYQIFPDRFANGDPSNDPPNVQPWGSPPTLWGFQGGDLRGIYERLDYLQDLGVTALYLNPIFSASANHRYNTIDYFTIDPRLGSQEDFHRLIGAIHDRRMKLILDGVFNHSGRGFPAFVDLLENEEHSAFRDWYHVLRFPLDAYGPGKAENYLAWWSIKSLPKFNTSHRGVRRMLLDVARHWIELGADGWRLDVPNEIDDDSFWAEFRSVVKRANADAYLLGEIWTVDPRWVGAGHFDGLMNYPLREAMLEFLVGDQLKAGEFARRVEDILSSYLPEHLMAHYLPLGTHDTPRVRTLCPDDRRLRQLLMVQFCLPGAPGIYYGDEIGLEGDKDPDSRRAFPWDETLWDVELRRYVQSLARVRKAEAALRRGAYRPVLADDGRGVMSFARRLDDHEARVVVNASDVTRAVVLPPGEAGWQAGRAVEDPLRGEARTIADSGLRIEVEPRGARLWLPVS
ncbi:MAG TPA: glycoside hydrolase family 13 protein [Anaerolineales bacterium]|nr:glycoside hydrolase family 13 protein [Anaerolineales bacterium]